MSNLSLSAYCKARNLPKSSVYKALKAEGFDTSEGLTSEAIQWADSYFLDAPVTEPTDATAITPTVIEVGNHRGALALPSAPAAINLADYRGDVALTSFEPEDVDRFLSSCDGFLEAVEADYHQQVTITQRKAQQAAAVKAKVDSVKEASLVYKLRSEQLALHNSVIDAQMQRDMATLGKPQPAESPQP